MIFKAVSAEPHNLLAALAMGQNFDVAAATTLLYSKQIILKLTKVNIRLEVFF
jgi:hypothetical protein